MIRGTLMGATIWPRNEELDLDSRETLNISLGGDVTCDITVPDGTIAAMGGVLREDVVMTSGAESYAVPAAKGKMLQVSGVAISEAGGRPYVRQTDSGPVNCLRKAIRSLEDEEFSLELVARPERKLTLKGFKPAA